MASLTQVVGTRMHSSLASFGPNIGASYNGVEWKFIAPFNSGETARVYYATDPEDTWTLDSDSFISSPAPMRQAMYANGDCLFFALNGTQMQCEKKTVGGSWTGSLTNVATVQSASYNYNVIVMTFNGTEYTYVLYFHSNTMKIVVSPDKGANWQALTGPGAGNHDSFLRGQHGLATDGTYLYAVYHHNNFPNPKPFIETGTFSEGPLALSWGNRTQISTRSTDDARPAGMLIKIKSNGNKRVVFDDKASGGLYLCKEDSPGSWADVGNAVGGSGGSMLLDDEDEILYAGSSGDGKLYRTDAFTEFADIGSFGFGIFPYQSFDLKFGETVWNICENFVDDTSFALWDGLNYPVGSDVDPPTGVAITSPFDGETGLVVSLNLTCSAGSDDTPPIQYEFSLDTVSTFDSGNLQTSDWLTVTNWTPPTNLTNGIIYYVRVRARDSVEPPNVSDYSAVISFGTIITPTGVGRLLLSSNSSIFANSGFEEGDTSFWAQSLGGTAAASFTAVQSDPAAGSWEGIIDISSEGALMNEILVTPDPVANFSFVQSDFYLLSFSGKADVARVIQVRATDANCSENIYGLLSSASLTTDWQTFSYIFNATTTSSVRIQFLMGVAGTVIELDSVFFTNVIELAPTYAYNASLVLDRHDIRTNNQLYTYVFQRHKKWSLPETWVSSYNRSQINSWWQTNQELKFFEDSSALGTIETVKIMNEEEPYQNYMPQHLRQYFEGTLELETVAKKT